MANCKYEVWKSAVTLTQRQRDIKFCQCKACLAAFKAFSLRAESTHPLVKERLAVLREKNPPPGDENKVDIP